MAIDYEEIGGESGQGRSCTQTRDWKRTYTKFFRAITDNSLIGPKAVREACPVVINNPYSAPGETDTGAFCSSISVAEDGAADDGRQWIVTCEYEVYLEVPENPLLMDPQIQYGSNRFQKAILFDINGDPIVNAAYDFFEETPEKDDSRSLLTLIRNEQGYDPALAENVKDSINKLPWWGKPEFTWKCLDVTAQMVLDQYGNKYWEITYEYEFNKDTWVLKLLDVGYNEAVLVSGAFDSKRQIRDKENHPLTSPRPLNPDGTAKGEDELPDEKEFHIYKEIDFVVFNFDAFYNKLKTQGLLK